MSRRSTGRAVPSRTESDDSVIGAGFGPIWFALKLSYWVTRFVVRFVWLAPWTALLAAVAAVVVYVWGTEMLANLTTVVLLVLGLWGLNHYGSYRLTAGKWWARWWRRWLVYVWWWPFIAARHGLAAQLVDPHSGGSYTDRRKLVQLRRVETAAGMDRLLVSLPVGVDHDALLRSTDSLAHALKAPVVRVRVHKPGRVWLDVVRRDTLQATVRPVPVPAMTTTPEAVAVLGGVPIGRCEDGTVWRLALRGSGLHVLVAGATGAGKGSVLWSLVHGLSDGIRCGLVEVIVLDPKRGQGFPTGQELFAQFHCGDPESMADVLDHLVVDMATRQDDLTSGRLPIAEGGAVHLPAPGSPHRVIIIDELITLTALSDAKTTRRINAALALLLTQGRAAGITIVAALQNPSKEVVQWRDLFPTRVGLRPGLPPATGHGPR